MILMIGAPFVFIICEPGMMMTNAFEIVGMNLYQCDWYTLSIEMQKMYMIFVSNTQNPISVSTYGDILCERERMKKVI